MVDHEKTVSGDEADKYTAKGHHPDLEELVLVRKVMDKLGVDEEGAALLMYSGNILFVSLSYAKAWWQKRLTKFFTKKTGKSNRY